MNTINQQKEAKNFAKNMESASLLPKQIEEIISHVRTSQVLHDVVFSSIISEADAKIIAE